MNWNGLAVNQRIFFWYRCKGILIFLIYVALFNDTTPAGQKHCINLGGIDHTFNIDAFVGSMDIFGYRTIAGRLSLTKEVKSPYIGGGGSA